jgi:hypothetical protein
LPVDALRSIAVAQHLFGIQNIVVVHHSHCGATTFTAGGIVDAFKNEHHADISDLYDRGSICIDDYEASLKYDTALVRSHAGTPKHVNIFGYFYDIDTGVLTEVVNDRANFSASTMAGISARLASSRPRALGANEKCPLEAPKRLHLYHGPLSGSAAQAPCVAKTGGFNE